MNAVMGVLESLTPCAKHILESASKFPVSMVVCFALGKRPAVSLCQKDLAGALSNINSCSSVQEYLDAYDRVVQSSGLLGEVNRLEALADEASSFISEHYPHLIGHIMMTRSEVDVVLN